jgi:hypothetical protein
MWAKRGQNLPAGVESAAHFIKIAGPMRCRTDQHQVRTGGK